MSSKTVGTEKSQTTDACTQTFSATPETTPTHSQSQSEDGHQQHSSDEFQENKEPVEVDYTKIDISSLRKLSSFPDLEETTPEAPQNDSSTLVSTSTEEKLDYFEENKTKKDKTGECSPVLAVDKDNESYADDEDEESSVYGTGDNDMENDEEFECDDESDIEEEAVVFEVATAQAPTRVAMVGTQVLQAKGAVVTIPKRIPPPLPTRSPARASRRRSQMVDVGSMAGSSPLRKEFDPIEVSGGATPRASKMLEPTSDAVSHNMTLDHNSAAEAKPTEAPANSATTPVHEFHERSVKRASHIVQSGLTEEHPDLSAVHNVAASVA